MGAVGAVGAAGVEAGGVAQPAITAATAVSRNGAGRVFEAEAGFMEASQAGQAKHTR
jgi:hypothetical protein